MREFLSVDIDISGLEVNQCDDVPSSMIDSGTNDIGKSADNQIKSFRGSHKCHDDTTQVNANFNRIKLMLNFIITFQSTSVL